VLTVDILALRASHLAAHKVSGKKSLILIALKKKNSSNNKRCICGQMCVSLLEKGDAKCSGANSEDLSYILYSIHVLRVLEAAARNILLPSNWSCWK